MPQRIVSEGDTVAYGKMFPEFWVHGTPYDGGAPGVANGVHFAFFATSREMVQAFYDTALASGGTCDGEPGPRPQYGDPYYGCYVRDPDGHKLEATFWDARHPTCSQTLLLAPHRARLARRARSAVSVLKISAGLAARASGVMLRLITAWLAR